MLIISRRKFIIPRLMIDYSNVNVNYFKNKVYNSKIKFAHSKIIFDISNSIVGNSKIKVENSKIKVNNSKKWMALIRFRSNEGGYAIQSFFLFQTVGQDFGYLFSQNNITMLICRFIER